MKVTENEFNDRKPIEGSYSQRVLAKQRGYVEASSQTGIIENNIIVTHSQTDKLLERILHRDNMNNAFKEVKSNKVSKVMKFVYCLQ